MNLRRVQVDDLVKLMACNLQNIPENYRMRYWEYSIITWPDLSFLAEDESGKVVGYVLSSIEPEESAPYVRVGYINSLSVLRPYRRLGLAQRLMNLSKDAMLRDIAGIEYIQLHVRKSNRSALSLYHKLGYNHHRTVAKYYADGEDAFIMRLPLRPSSDTQRRKWRTWITNLWRFVHDKPHQLADAAMSLLRRRNSIP
ncbi:putative N-terminal acetyltransferase complex subunit ARD1 [Boletus edulis]|uniref:N-terminal acetyltransferase complex subunit ARD1 n=1 Tax=Boletus edulis BED1 TaxID=1328754 RepID=A0AAD4C0G9_BOLED|nr:putative N-terminal acetyltransferase complex subunit ARD1 [Boletus edulis]KAF8444844.1 putative N-terminal acetyltransferase complex subunit ARD1 [Boletus edulis BED1]